MVEKTNHLLKARKKKWVYRNGSWQGIAPKHMSPETYFLQLAFQKISRNSKDSDPARDLDFLGACEGHCMTTS